MATYMVDHGFNQREWGYGNAVALILFVISFVAASASARLAATNHRPWIGSGDTLRWVRIRPYSITGRRIAPRE